MAKNPQRQSLKNSRKRAFKAQHGACYYCSQPMWTNSADELTARYPISSKQARWLQCTGEHLMPLSEGGSRAQANIVAACWYCNIGRHKRSVALAPEDHRMHVQKGWRQANGTASFWSSKIVHEQQTQRVMAVAILSQA